MRRALLISCNDYKDAAFHALRFPKSDAERLRTLLLEQCSFDEVDTVIDPSKSEAHRAIDTLAADGAADDLILIYFSGHGKLTRDGSLALVLNDTEERLLHSTAIVDDSLRQMLQACRARQKILILDCCHSGAAGEKHFKGDASDAFHAMAQQAGGTFVLVASTKFQPAFEDAEMEGSIFTSVLIEGVQSGAASHRAKEITLANLGDYLMREVPKRREQQPKYWDFGGLGGFVLALTGGNFDEAFERKAKKELSRLLSDEQIDEDLYDEVRAALKLPRGPKRLARLRLLDELVNGTLKPLPFKRRWDALTVEVPGTAAAQPVIAASPREGQAVAPPLPPSPIDLPPPSGWLLERLILGTWYDRGGNEYVISERPTNGGKQSNLQALQKNQSTPDGTIGGASVKGETVSFNAWLPLMGGFTGKLVRSSGGGGDTLVGQYGTAERSWNVTLYRSPEPPKPSTLLDIHPLNPWTELLKFTKK